LAGCAGPIRSVAPGDVWPSGSPALDSAYNPIRPFGSNSQGPPGVDFDFEAAGIPSDHQPGFALADGLHKVQVVNGRIVSSELIPNGRPSEEQPVESR
jgi:hypothetical protein